MAEPPRGVSIMDVPARRRGGLEAIVAPSRFTIGIGALVAALAGVVGAEWLIPGARLAVEAPELDVVISTTELVVALLVCALAWTRYRDDHEPASLYETAAFGALATAGLLTLVSQVDGSGLDAGDGLAATHQGVVYFWAGVRALAAGLLVCTGLALLGGLRLPAARLRAGAVAIPILAVVLFAAFVARAGDSLPALINAPPQRAGAGADLTSITPAGYLTGATALDVAIQAAIGAAFLAAAALATVAYSRRSAVAVGCLAIGLVLAAFAQLHEAVDPTNFSALVCTGDVLRLGFNGVLLVGILAQRRDELRELRAAYRNLDQLHVLDLERRALEERNQAAREVHDGIVQDLWLIRLRLEGLRNDASPRAAARRDLLQLIDRTIEDARHTIAALRGRRTATHSFDDALERLATELGSATGIRVDFAVDARADIADDDARREVLRIAAEALSNIGRHADATVARVTASRVAGGLELVISDNGVGFDPQARRAGLGLEGMRSRAMELGAELTVTSAPESGTEVRLRVPDESTSA